MIRGIGFLVPVQSLGTISRSESYNSGQTMVSGLYRIAVGEDILSVPEVARLFFILQLLLLKKVERKISHRNCTVPSILLWLIIMK